VQDLASAFTTAFGLILSLDPAVLAIVALSLRVSLSALFLAALIGLPLGALWRWRGFRGGAA
jgi:tungstate transport system permease protein